MKMLIVVAAVSMLGLTACESQADKAAEKQADALESQAAASPNETTETQLNQKADRIEQEAGNADGGATTENTPTTEPETK